MKRILLLLVTFMSFSVKADMDEICLVADPVAITVDDVTTIVEKSKCDRNNVLTVLNLYPTEIIYVIDKYCRYDREINYMERGNNNKYALTCVLYSREGREVRNILTSRPRD